MPPLGARPLSPEEGGPVYQVNPVRTGAADDKAARCELFFADEKIDFSRIRPGDLLWRTADPALEKLWRRWADPKQLPATVAVRLQVDAQVGQPLNVLATTRHRCWPGVQTTVLGDVATTPPHKRPVSIELLSEQLGRLGGTPFYLEQLAWNDAADEPVFVPVSELNSIRRKLVTQLSELLINQHPGRGQAAGTIRRPIIQEQAAERWPSNGNRWHLLIQYSRTAGCSIGSAAGFDHPGLPGTVRAAARGPTHSRSWN